LVSRGEVEMSESAEFLTTSTVAGLAHVSAESVRVWERRGWLRAVRTPTGIRLFERADVLRFLRERRDRVLARYSVGDERGEVVGGGEPREKIAG
jgi:predicted site-specific integrase-resolvase